MDRVVDLQTGISFDVNNANPVFVCEIFKNQFTHAYKMNLLETKDLYFKMKKLVYPLLSFNENLVLEYELKYGKFLIYEGVDKLDVIKSIEESWDFVKYKITQALPILLEDWLSDTWNKTKNAVGSAASWVGDKLKQAGQWVLNKGLPWFFEKLETFLLSPVGIGVDVALNALGIGKVASSILWGALGVWKIYQLLSGQSDSGSWFTYIDIALCLVGLVFTGGAAKGIKALVGAAGRDIRKILTSPLIKPIIDLVAKGAGLINSAILKPLDWLAKTLGGPKITAMINAVKNGIGRIITKIDEMTKLANPSVSQTVQTGIKKDIINPAARALRNKGPVSLGKAAQKGATAGLAFYGGEKLLHKGVEKYGEYKTEKATGEIISKTTTAMDNDISAILTKYQK